MSRLERLVREASANKEYEKIRKIVEQLCHDYAYAVHQPHARNGGLIGLAAASIALGTDEVARYLAEIVPPVLACFTDQDARVRYYACEAMYNIAKVAKGEILLFFNEIFDALCKLAADSELSVKNGAELLDRLVKDIVSESAASYVSILNYNEKEPDADGGTAISEHSSRELPMAFSLAKFIPLLEERIHVINPFTRTFLVSWLTLLDTIPDLELVYYLPSFLGGLFKFLGDPNRDVYVATQGLLERFLDEIKKIAKIKRGLKVKKSSTQGDRQKVTSASPAGSAQAEDDASNDNAIDDSQSGSAEDEPDDIQDGDWIPGQDVQVDHAAVLDILLKFVDVSSNKDSAPLLKIEGLSKQKEEEIGIVALRWIDSFFEISPEDILQFVPRLLSQVLPALSAQSDQVQTTASRVNRSLMDYIVTFEDEIASDEKSVQPATSIPTPMSRSAELQDGRRQSGPNTKSSPPAASTRVDTPTDTIQLQQNLTPRSSAAQTPQPTAQLDYAAAVNALTLEFLNEHEATRVAALGWLIMLHRKAPKKVLAFNDGTFPALLKTLSDPADAVVTRDLQLLSQISKNSEDGYFTSFMVNLLQLFSTDRKLLEIRGNLIIRQLCLNLMPERIYRTLADCIEKDEDIEFASIMVQNLNNNLITAPELAELRKRLRNLESRDGQMFFVALFRAWCYNAVATFSLCLLAQAYEQAYNLLQIFAELEMTVNMLIQIDKLVQLLESPVFTCKQAAEDSRREKTLTAHTDLRLQLLEPDRYPYLYKCLYGLLMLLPQSSAFAALKNRLNSVSAIGLLHTPASMPTPSRSSVVTGMSSAPSAGTSTSASLPGRLGRTRDATGDIKWPELLEKFRATQEKARKRNLALMRGAAFEDDAANLGGGPATKSLLELADTNESKNARPGSGLSIRPGSGLAGREIGPARPGPTTEGAFGSGLGTAQGHKSRQSIAGNLGRFTSGIRGGQSKTKK